jgi:hypothetical protein
MKTTIQKKLTKKTIRVIDTPSGFHENLDTKKSESRFSWKPLSVSYHPDGFHENLIHFFFVTRRPKERKEERKEKTGQRKRERERRERERRERGETGERERRERERNQFLLRENLYYGPILVSSSHHADIKSTFSNKKSYPFVKTKLAVIRLIPFWNLFFLRQTYSSKVCNSYCTTNKCLDNSILN